MSAKDKAKETVQTFAQKVEEKKENFDKSPMESKKFIYATLFGLGWLGLIFYGLRLLEGCDLSVVNMQSVIELLQYMVVVAGLVNMFYLGGQAFQDALVKAVVAWVGGKIPQSPQPINSHTQNPLSSRGGSDPEDKSL